ncbi:MAG: iron ABC transporter permease [Zoogloeaceae bacterium]|jgi:iron complex transport system permease protein|nr:iron ABC transporter permease [Zoogloeaceae bacterium]
MMRLRQRVGKWRPTRWLALGVLLALVMLTALCVGRYTLPASHVSAMILSHVMPSDWMDLMGGKTWTAAEWRVVHSVRAPRILLAALIGAGLAMSGAALQGAFRNPLVGPQILGISSGAAFGGCLAILMFTSLAAILGFAFIGGALAIIAVYALTWTRQRSTTLILILAGIITGAFFGAMISLVTYMADPDDTLPAIVFWLMGSFATASYFKLVAILAPMLFGMAILMAQRFCINVLSLGDEHAAALGLRVERQRWLLLTAVTLIVSSGVAVSGAVGWVGLVIPHAARMIFGPDHRTLLPASAFIGAIYLVIIDTIARSATAAEMPLSVITALIGAPVFAWLLRRAHDKGWSHG